MKIKSVKLLLLGKILDMAHRLRLDKYKFIRKTGYEFLYSFLNSIKPEDAVIINTIYDLRLFVIPHSPIGRKLLSEGIWEEEITNFLIKNLTKDDIFVDVGANIGYFTCLASKIVDKEGFVFSFEPEPFNFDILLRNIKLNKLSNVTCERLACSYSIGTSKLFLNPAEPGGHSMYRYKEIKKYIIVETVTLDHYFSCINPSLPRIIKIDVEGAELHVLRGMSKLISKSKDIQIIFEYNPIFLREIGVSVTELVEFISKKTLRPYIIHTNGDIEPIFTTRLKNIHKTVNILLQK